MAVKKKRVFVKSNPPESEGVENENPQENTDSPGSDTALNSNEPVSDIELPGRNDSSFSEENLKSIRKERAKEKREKKQTRGPGRPRKTSADKKKELILPVFMFANALMQNRGIQPLSEEEMNTGVEAWFPLVDHYAPKLEKYTMFIAPIMWTTGVVMVRMPMSEKALPEPIQVNPEVGDDRKNG